MRGSFDTIRIAASGFDQMRLVVLDGGATVARPKSDERWLAGNYHHCSDQRTCYRAGVKSAKSSQSAVVHLPYVHTSRQHRHLSWVMWISSGANVDGLVLRFRMDWRPWLTVTFSGSDRSPRPQS